MSGCCSMGKSTLVSGTTSHAYTSLLRAVHASQSMGLTSCPSEARSFTSSTSPSTTMPSPEPLLLMTPNTPMPTATMATARAAKAPTSLLPRKPPSACGTPASSAAVPAGTMRPWARFTSGPRCTCAPLGASAFGSSPGAAMRVPPPALRTPSGRSADGRLPRSAATAALSSARSPSGAARRSSASCCSLAAPLWPTLR